MNNTKRYLSDENNHALRRKRDSNFRENGHLSSTIPTIPGLGVNRFEREELIRRVANILGLSSNSFPGSQPVSFLKEHINELKKENYFVCEKSDGVRVLLLITCTDKPKSYLIDRKNFYKYVPDLIFPLPQTENSRHKYHDGTIVDGELVLDTEEDGSKVLRFLAFDLLSVNGVNVMSKPLDKRLGYLDMHLLKPYREMLKTNSMLKQRQPFIFEMKRMEFSYGLVKVLDEDIPKLKHKNDGLVFTSTLAPYTPGTCYKIFKWKPPEENSIDFKLRVRKGETDGEMPNFELHTWKGGSEYEFFDNLGVSAQEWESLKNIADLDGKIVEVVKDPEHCPPYTWKFLRFRNDKFNGNHESIVEKIIQSIEEGVSSSELKDKAQDIRTAWKSRQSR